MAIAIRKQDRFRLGLLILLVGSVTALHYLTATHYMQFHDIYRRLYYLPIILGGLWYGIPGGAGVAILVSVIYAPHVLYQWGHMPADNLEKYLEILLYNLIGFVTGFLSSRIFAERRQVEENMQRLQESYAKLREQADLIMEIEDQLRQADRLTALGELSAGMAHEIRNPLGSIRGTAEILKDALPADSRYGEFGEILISEVERLNKVVEDFLSFARSEQTETEDFDPNSVLREVLQFSRQQLKRQRTEIEWQEVALPRVIGNAGQFKQVFLNLILNALQAMGDKGRIRINGALDDKGRVVLSFQDSGPGIATENLDKVFNPFFTTKSDGTGLGLAITYRIVQNHGGRISVANVPAGGAEFRLELQPAMR